MRITMSLNMRMNTCLSHAINGPDSNVFKRAKVLDIILKLRKSEYNFKKF